MRRAPRSDERGPLRAVVACGGLGLAVLLTGCLSPDDGGLGDGSCTSSYTRTTRADSRVDLVAKLRERSSGKLAGERDVRPLLGEPFERGGADVRTFGFYIGHGDGRRVGPSLEVVRLTDGTWFAGTWSQCIDSGDGSTTYPSGWPST